MIHSSLVSVAAQMARDVYRVPSDYWIASEGGVTWMAIEGSDCPVDWRRNLEFVMTADDVHAGFQNYATKLMADMLAAGVELNPEHKLVLCGHSLGGAVATVIAAHLQERFSDMRLVTFGSPRPGGRRFRDRLTIPHYRFVHGNDVVPRLPSPLFGFRHAGPEIKLTIPEDNVFKGVKDHDMDGYLRAVCL